MKTTKCFTNLVIGTVAGMSVVSLLLPQISWAQTTDVNPLEDANPAEEGSDPFSGSGGNSFGIFDLIHRANFGGDRNVEDFSLEQDQNLNSAAAQFRKKQLERLQQRQATPATVTTPNVNAN